MKSRTGCNWLDPWTSFALFMLNDSVTVPDFQNNSVMLSVVRSQHERRQISRGSDHGRLCWSQKTETAQNVASFLKEFHFKWNIPLWFHARVETPATCWNICWRTPRYLMPCSALISSDLLNFFIYSSTLSSQTLCSFTYSHVPARECRRRTHTAPSSGGVEKLQSACLSRSGAPK